MGASELPSVRAGLNESAESRRGPRTPSGRTAVVLYFLVIGFDEAQTRSLFQDMESRGPTELIRKRELPPTVLPSSIWVNSLFSDLTGKQIEAVMKAHRHGYYLSPRQAKTENIAAGLGVSRSTFEEHLRKAENRIIASLVPYLQLYAYGERPIAEGG